MLSQCLRISGSIAAAARCPHAMASSKYSLGSSVRIAVGFSVTQPHDMRAGLTVRNLELFRDRVRSFAAGASPQGRFKSLQPLALGPAGESRRELVPKIQ